MRSASITGAERRSPTTSATVLLPEAEKSLTEADWHALNVAFATHRDPLNDRGARDPQFDRLFTRIVMRAPAPVGLGEP